MIKKLVLFTALLGLVAIAGSAYAEGTNLLDQAGDIITGRKDNVEVHPYIAYTVKDTVKIKGIPVIPKNLRVKYSPGKLGKEEGTRLHKIEAGIEF